MSAPRYRLELADGHYPGNMVIRGAPFGINFWIVATDISEEQARERIAFAKELVAVWNAAASEQENDQCPE